MENPKYIGFKSSNTRLIEYSGDILYDQNRMFPCLLLSRASITSHRAVAVSHFILQPNCKPRMMFLSLGITLLGYVYTLSSVYILSSSFDIRSNTLTTCRSFTYWGLLFLGIGLTTSLRQRPGKEFQRIDLLTIMVCTVPGRVREIMSKLVL